MLKFKWIILSQIEENVSETKVFIEYLFSVKQFKLGLRVFRYFKQKTSQGSSDS